MRAALRIALLLPFLAGCGEGDTAEGTRLVEGDPANGLRIMQRLECSACHVIPGLRGAQAHVGPALSGFARRGYIGGILPNRPALLVDWVRDAPAFAPDTAMPPFVLTEHEARDIAAYLYTLD